MSEGDHDVELLVFRASVMGVGFDDFVDAGSSETSVTSSYH